MFVSFDIQRNKLHGAIIADPADPVAGSSPAGWAMDELEKSLVSKRIEVTRYRKISEAGRGRS